MTYSNANRLPKGLVSSAAIAVLILVILYALGIIGGGDKVEPGSTEIAGEPVPEAAQTLTLVKQNAAVSVTWPGTLRARSVAKLAPKVNARILDVKVNAGDFVKPGEIIALLDDRVYRAAYHETGAALSAAQALAVQAKADESRIKDLYHQDAATRESFDAATARAKAAQASVNRAASAVEQARVVLGDNVLRAPFSGIISQRLKEPGDMGSPNEAIVVLQKRDTLRFEAAIPANCVNRIELGMPVTVRTENPVRSWQAKVTEIVPEIDPQTRSQWVKADLLFDESLEHGQYGWLTLDCGERRPSLWIPASAVLHYGQLEVVKIVENGKLHSRHVRTGKRRNDHVEILSGLHEGETIITGGGRPQ